MVDHGLSVFLIVFRHFPMTISHQVYRGSPFGSQPIAMGKS